MKTVHLSPRQKAVQVILIFLAIAAALAGVGGLADLADAPKTILAVETWRTVGFFTFAALFSLLAKKPDSNRELWGIVIANKLALTVIGVLYLINGGIDGASDFVSFDGMVTVLLIVASILQGVWKRKSMRS
jgi:peptidoglycan/LPS O-acetylase OafA/YrhL